MGISNPDVGYNGISPSDDILALEPTQRGTSSTTWVPLYRGLWLADITTGSIMRVKADMHVNNAKIGSMVWRINDEYPTGLWFDSTVNNAWETKTDDVEVYWKRNSTITIYAKVQTGDTVYLKNISICGIQSPSVLWVA